MRAKSEQQMKMFCKNVEKLRIANNLTKLEMAKVLGISVHALSLIESGVLPRRTGCVVLFNIHDNFGIMPSEMLIEWEEE